MWRSIDIESGKVQHLCALLTHCYSSSAINEKTWIIPAGKWLDVLFKNIQLKFLHIINAYNCYNPYSVCSNYVYKDTNVLKTCWTSLNSNTKYKRLFVWIHVALMRLYQGGHPTRVRTYWVHLRIDCIFVRIWSINAQTEVWKFREAL